MQEIHVDRRVVGWSAGRHVDHPCGGQNLPWPARKITECNDFEKNGSVLVLFKAQLGEPFL